MKVLIKKWLALYVLATTLLTTTGIQNIQLQNLITIPEAQAAANLSCSNSILPAASATSGESFTYSVSIDNTGGPESGFQPFIDVIQAPEIIFNSATLSVGGASITPSSVTVPVSGEITHPLTSELISGLTPGFILYTFQFPLTSIAPGQGPFTIDIGTTVDSAAPLFVPLADSVQSRCGFGLGEDPLRNPGTDPALTTALESFEITPNVFSVSKSVVLPEEEVSTGPNHPVTFNLSSHIGNGATLPITNLTLSDPLPSGFIIDPSISPIVVNDTSANGCTITYTPDVGPAVSDGGLCDPSLLGVGPFGPGGTIDVDFTSVPAGVGDPSLSFVGYFNEFDSLGNPILDPTTGAAPVSQDNTLFGSGDYDGNALNTSDGPISIEVDPFNIVKTTGFAPGGNILDAGYQPGDTVEFNIDIDISDYFSIENLAIEDTMSDGFSYVPGSLEVTINEAGSSDGPFDSTDFTEIITPETTVPAALSSGPPFDFSNCDGAANPCQLLISEDQTDDDDGGVITDGQTQLILDISQIMIDQNTAGQANGELAGPGAIGNAASVQISYQAVINESYIDSNGLFDESIDATDPLSNAILIHGDISSGPAPGNAISENSSTSINIVGATYSKDLIAINGSAVVGTPQVKAGDDVTFSFLIDIPSGDAEDFTLTDYLPQPVFDASSLPAISFDTASNDDGSIVADTRYELGGANGVPSTNQIGFGTQTSGISAPYPLPDVVTIDPSSNSFSISFPDNTTFDETPSDGVTIELFITVQVEDKPFADGLGIFNFAELDISNSTTASAITSSAVTSVVLQAPDLDITKSVVGDNGENTTIDPVLPAYLTFDDPASTPSITAGFPISSDGDIDNEELDSDIQAVDAGDLVTFAVIVENISGTDAHDVVVTDTIPTGLVLPAGGPNIQIYDGQGVNLAAQTEGGLFGTVPTGGTTDSSGDNSLQFLTPLSLLDADTEEGGVNQGENIAIITYDLEVDQSVEPLQQIENQAGITNFASNPAGANYAAGQEEFYQDSAEVEIQTMRYYKNVNSSDQASTSGSDATIGEVVTYEVAVELPEGSTPNLVMRDQVPSRLGVYTTPGITIDTTGASCSLITNPFNGTVPAPTINSPATPVGGSGNDLNVSFAGPIEVTNDNDPDNNIFCILYDVVVLDNASNQNGSSRNNRVDFDFGTLGNTTDSFPNDSSSPDFGSADKRARIDIVDPNLNIQKNIYLPGTTTIPTSIDAGDILEYSIEIEHAGDSGNSAFDLEIIDNLSGLPVTVIDTFSSDGLDNTGSGADDEPSDGLAAAFWDGSQFTFNNTTTGNPLFNELGLAQSFEIRFQIEVGDLVAPAQLIQNEATIESDTIPGVNADPNIAAEERTETDSDTVDFSVDATSISKAILSTDDANTGSAEHVGANQDLSIGEQVTYRITVDVPEGQILNGVITDVLPDFLRADSASIFDNGTGVIVNPQINLQDTKFADTLNDTVQLTFDSYTFPPTVGNSNTTILIDVVATLIDQPPLPNTGNTDADILANQASITYDTLATPQNSNTVNIDVVEPDVTLSKTVSACASPCDDGSEVTYTITATNNGTATAYDLEITDDLSGLPIDLVDTFSTDGLDNTGSGADDEPSDGVAAAFWDGTEFTFNNTTTGLALFNELDPGQSITLQFRVAVNDTALFGETISNSADLDYLSSPTANPDGRSYSENDTADFQTENITQINKVVTSSSNSDTGASQHVPANQDLAIGEQVTYTITIPNIPELTANNFEITEQLPPVLRYDSSSVNFNGITNSFLAETTQDLAPADGIVDNVVFDFGTITNPSGNGLQNIEITINATVVDDVLNQDSELDTNNVSLSFDEVVAGPLTGTAQTDIVEPFIDVQKTVVGCTSPCDANAVITYQVQLTNTGTAPAYDIEITDDPSSLPITVVDTFSSDGLDNTGSGADDEPSDGVAAAFWDGTEFTFNSTTTSNTDFDQLDPTQSITLRYSATVDGGVIGGTTITNQADVTFDSSPGVNPDQRTYTADDTASIDVTLITDSVTKVITSTDNPSTTASQFDNSLQDLAIGEQVTYLITIPNIPENSFTGVVATDILPTFLRFDSATVNTNGITTAFVAETVQDLAPVDGFSETITFDFGNINNPLGNGFRDIEITINATVINDPANSNSSVLTNNVSFDYNENTAPVFTANEAAEIVEPDLDIQKTVSACVSPCFAGSQVVYTLDITNNGNGPAHDLEILDDLSAIGVTPVGDFSSDGLDNTGSGADDELNDGDAAAFYTLATELFTFNSTTTGNTKFDTLLPGESIQIEFNAEIETGTTPLQTITNQADLSYDSFPGANVNQKSYAELDTVDLTLDDFDPIIQKQITATSLAQTGSSELNPANPDLAIGEQVTYTITVPNIPTTSLSDLTVTDTLPLAFRFDSATVNTNSIVTAFTVETVQDIAPVDGFSETVTFDFGNISNAPANGLQDIEITINATVLDNISNFTSTPYTNLVEVDFTENNDPPSTSFAVADVVEPSLTLTKTASPCPPNCDVGSQVDYTIELSNTGAAPAFDIEIVDNMSGIPLIPLGNFSSDGLDNTGSGADDELSDGDAAAFYNLATETLTFNNTTTGNAEFNQLDPGETITIEFTAEVESDLIIGQDIVNQISAESYSVTSTDPEARLYPSLSSETVTSSNLISFDKQVSSTSLSETNLSAYNPTDPDVAIGEEVTYQLTIQNITEGNLTNVRVVDTLPATLEYVSSSINFNGITTDFTAATTQDIAPADGIIDTITFDLGTVTNPLGNGLQDIVIDVTALVLDDPANTAGPGYTNSSTLFADQLIGGQVTETASIDIVEPSINIDKSVSPLSGAPADQFNYTITVTNSGFGPAYNVNVTDPLQANLDVVDTFSTDGLDNDGLNGIDDPGETDGVNAFWDGSSFDWNIPVILSGETITIRFLSDVTGVSANQVITNTSSVTFDSSTGPTSRSDNDDDDASLTIPFTGQLLKTSTLTDTNITVGQVVPYRVTLYVPQNTMFSSLTGQDIFPTGLAFVPGSLVVSSNAASIGNLTSGAELLVENLDPILVQTPNSNNIPLTTQQQIDLDFGQVENTSPTQVAEIYLDYNALVLNTSDVAAGQTKVNSFEVDYDGVSVGPATSPVLTVVEPTVEVVKSVASNQGDTITYELQIFNDSPTTAYNPVITDQLVLPETTFITGTPVEISGPGNLSTIQTDSQNIQFTFPSIDPIYTSANPIIIQYQVAIDTSLASGTIFNNNVEYQWTTNQTPTQGDLISGTDVDTFRSGDDSLGGLLENDHIDNTFIPATVTRPDLSTSTKSVVDLNGGLVAPGDILEFTIDIINSGNNDATGVIVTDQVDVDFNTLDILSIPVGANDASLSNPDGDNGEGAVIINNISIAQSSTEQIVYRLTVDKGIGVGVSLDNTFQTNSANEGGPPGSGSTNNITDAPIINLQKDVSDTKPDINDIITYTITIENTGTAPSTNLTIVDEIQSGLDYIPNETKLDFNSVITQQTDAQDLDGFDFNITTLNTLTLVIPSLDVGDIAIITYEATPTPSSKGRSVINTAIATDDQGSSITDNAIISVPRPASSGSSSSRSVDTCNPFDQNCNTDRKNITDPPEDTPDQEDSEKSILDMGDSPEPSESDSPGDENLLGSAPDEEEDINLLGEIPEVRSEFYLQSGHDYYNIYILGLLGLLLLGGISFYKRFRLENDK